MRNNKKGLSLLEMLGAIAILAILGLLSIPMMFTVGNNTRIKSATHTVKNLVEIARQNAIQNRNQITMTINVATNTITLSDGATNIEKIWSAPNLVDIMGVSRASYNGLSNSEVITFGINGSPTLSGTNDQIFIHVTSKGVQINGSDYDETSAYTNPVTFDNEERVKCHTVVINSINGSPMVFSYGFGDPWAETIL